MRFATMACVVSALLMGTIGDAAAQASDQKAVAEHLFEEGRNLLIGKDPAAACPKLAESQRLDPSIGTALYLAACYEKIGKTASAWAEFREAEELAARGGDTKRAAIARARADALAGSLTKLVIVVPEPARAKGLTIVRDGLAVGEATWGTSVPLDPGKHLIEVTAPGKRPATLSVDVNSPLVEVIVPTLEDVAPEPAPATAPTTAPAPPAPPIDRAPPPDTATGKTSDLRALGIAAGAVGAASVVAGLAFTLRTSSLVSDASSKGCNTATSPVQCPDTPDGRDGLASMDEARKTWRPLSIAAFAVGGVLGAVGGVLFFTSRSNGSSRSVVLSPAMSAQSAGLLLEGTL